METMGPLRRALDEAELESDGDDYGSEEGSESGYRSMSDLERYQDLPPCLPPLVLPRDNLVPVLLLVDVTTAGLESDTSVSIPESEPVSQKSEEERTTGKMDPAEGTKPAFVSSVQAESASLNWIADKITSGSVSWFLKLAVEIEAHCGSTVQKEVGSLDKCWHKFVPDFLSRVLRVINAACAGGLLCCLLHSPGMPPVVVVNPVRKTWEAVPDPPLGSEYHFVSMSYQESQSSYRVLLIRHQDLPNSAAHGFPDHKVYDDGSEELGTSYLQMTICAYESGNDVWETSKHIVPVAFSRIMGNITACNGRRYWLAESKLYGLTVVCYGDEEDSFSVIPIPECSFVTRHSVDWSNPCISCNLIELQGKLCLVGEVHNDSGESGMCVCVWELDGETWHGTDKIESEELLKLLPHNRHRGFVFAGQGDKLGLFVRGTPILLLYSVISKSLHSFPACPYDVDYSEEAECQRYTSVVHAFQPSLDHPEALFSKARRSCETGVLTKASNVPDEGTVSMPAVSS